MVTCVWPNVILNNIDSGDTVIHRQHSVIQYLQPMGITRMLQHASRIAANLQHGVKMTSK